MFVLYRLAAQQTHGGKGGAVDNSESIVTVNGNFGLKIYRIRTYIHVELKIEEVSAPKRR